MLTKRIPCNSLHRQAAEVEDLGAEGLFPAGGLGTLASRGRALRSLEDDPCEAPEAESWAIGRHTTESTLPSL
jgi:hypothetical protein